jgi:hypothetical protein
MMKELTVSGWRNPILRFLTVATILAIAILYSCEQDEDIHAEE